jgi:hypothetical protein
MPAELRDPLGRMTGLLPPCRRHHIRRPRIFSQLKGLLFDECSEGVPSATLQARGLETVSHGRER